MSYSYTRRPRPEQIRVMKRIFRTKRHLVWGEIGTGKTKVALDFIGTMLFHKKIKRALVVTTLTSLVGTWEEQIELDLPSVKYSRLIAHENVDWSVPLILTNYDYFIARRVKKRSKRSGEVIEDKFIRDKSRLNTLIEWEPDVVILDESHKIKNPVSQAAKASHNLGRVCTYAICLTGTPKGNKRILDLWSQFQFIYPGLLDSTFSDFKERYCIFGGFNGYEIKKFRNVRNLTSTILPYMTRMKQRGLPKKVDIDYRVDMDLKAKQLYKRMEKEMLVELENEKTVTAPIVLAKLTKLAQISGGFIRDEDGIDHLIHRNKLDALRDICDELKNSDVKRVVIFARFRWEIQQICRLLTDWTTYEITGAITPNDRKLAISLFNSNGGAMVCQIATGSTSLNLQAANYMIFFSTDFSFINFKQAKGRIHRLGQTKPCFYYYLRCKGTIDGHVYKLLKEHQSFEEGFLKILEEMKK